MGNLFSEVVACNITFQCWSCKALMKYMPALIHPQIPCFSNLPHYRPCTAHSVLVGLASFTLFSNPPRPTPQCHCYNEHKSALSQVPVSLQPFRHHCWPATQGTPGSGSFAGPAGATSASQLTCMAQAGMLLSQRNAKPMYPDATPAS